MFNSSFYFDIKRQVYLSLLILNLQFYLSLLILYLQVCLSPFISNVGFFHSLYIACLIRYVTNVFSEEDTKDKGKLYKPQSRLAAATTTEISSTEQAQAFAKLLAGEKKPERLGKKKGQSKSNLEMFKEELRQ